MYTLTLVVFFENKVTGKCMSLFFSYDSKIVPGLPDLWVMSFGTGICTEVGDTELLNFSVCTI